MRLLRGDALPRGGDAAPLAEALAPAENNRPRQLDSLTGLRFFAAFAILFAHACDWVAPFKDSDFISRYGGATSIYGMPLFFVLSGFVIHYNYWHLFSRMRFRWAALEFFGARFARLYPLFIACFAVGLIIDGTYDWLDGGHADWWFELVGHFLTMTQSWFYIIIFDDRLLMDNAYGLAWSISTEFFFYLCYMGIAFFILRLHTIRSTVATCLIFSAICLSSFTFIRWHLNGFVDLAKPYINNFISTDQNWKTSFVRWFFYYSPYCRIFEFILGCLTAHLYLHTRNRPITASEARWSHFALAAALVSLLVAGVLSVSEYPSRHLHTLVQFLALNFLCAGPIAVLIFCVSRYDSGISRFLCTGRLVVLGEISYSIYSVHTWTLRIFIRQPVDLTWAGAVDAVTRVGLGVAVTLVLATTTYRLIEIPGRAKLRRFFSWGAVAMFGSRKNNFRGRAPGLVSSLMAAGSLVLFLATCLGYQLTQ